MLLLPEDVYAFDPVEFSALARETEALAVELQTELQSAREFA